MDNIKNYIIKIKDMHKWYGDFHVLNNINLNVKKEREDSHLRAIRLR